MKAISQVLVAQFYRRNFLFFLLVFTFLGMVFRPPYLLVSEVFVPPMLEDGLFFSIVISLLLLYQLKCWRESWQAVHRPENKFLFILGGLENKQALPIIFRQVLGVMAPAVGYSLVIGAYSIYAGTWHMWAILVGQLLILLLVSTHILIRLRFPAEVSIKSGLQAWLEARFKQSFAFISLQMLAHFHNRSLLIHKGIFIAGTIAVMITHQSSPFSAKALSLIFLCFATLQCMLAYQLRNIEDRLIFSLRNLPVPKFKRYRAYLTMGILLFLPEVLLIGSFGGMAIGNALFWMGSYLLCATFFFMMGIATLYYRNLLPFEYLKVALIAFFVIFMLSLYGIPLWGMALAGLALSSWVFMDEFDKWNGMA